jgi:hypothetical protein
VAAFRTNFWKLLSEKEQSESERYTNITALADKIGTTRPTLYKYADEPMTSVDAGVIYSFLKFFDLGVDEIGKFLVIDLSPQPDAQEIRVSGAAETAVPAT